MNINREEQLKHYKKLLIIVDMVNGFVKKGNMADPTIGHIVDEQIRLINMIKEEKGIVAFVCDNHTEQSSELDKYPQHCLKDSKESQVIDELQQYTTDSLMYYKNSTSFVFAKNFIDDLNKMVELEEIIGVGCCSDICILNGFISLINYLDEINRRIKITIPINAIETYDSPTHKRDEYNKMAYKLLEQSGAKLVKKYERGNRYEK